MYNHNKAQQSKNRVHISWDILYVYKTPGPPFTKQAVVLPYDLVKTWSRKFGV